MAFYDENSVIVLTANFALANGTAADPTTVTLILTNPLGVSTTYTGGQITRNGVGAYQYNVSSGLTSGHWTYRFVGVGAVQTGGDGAFDVY